MKKARPTNPPAVSRERTLYLRRKRRRTHLVHACQIGFLVFFFAQWEISARLGWIDSFILSQPSRILETLRNMSQNHLMMHVGVTLYETLTGFVLGVLLGVAIAVVLWWSGFVSRVAEPYLVVLNSLPKSALAPLLIVWLGANQKPIIVAGISVAIFGSIINLYTGFHEIDKDKIKLIATLGGTKLDTLLKVVLPSSIPLILSVMKVNIGLCLVGVIIGEFIGARQGLGYLIIYGSQVFKLSWVLMSIVILCIIAMALYSLINLAERRYLNKK